MTGGEVEARLTNGTLGITNRYARGSCVVRAQGRLLRPWEVGSIHPPVRGRDVLGWLVVGEVSVATAATVRWMAPVVGVPKRGQAVKGGLDRDGLRCLMPSSIDRLRVPLYVIASPEAVEDLIVTPAPDLPESGRQRSARPVDEELVAHLDALTSLAERDGHDHQVSGLERSPATCAHGERVDLHRPCHPHAAPLRRSRHR